MSIIFLYISQTWEVPTVHPQEARPPPAAVAQPGYEGLGESTAWGPSGVAGLRSQTSRAEWGKKSTKNNKEWRISPAKLKLRFQTNIRILSDLLFNLRHIDTSKKMGLAKQTLWHGMCFVVFSILGGVNCLVICIANLKLFFSTSASKKLGYVGWCWWSRHSGVTWSQGLNQSKPSLDVKAVVPGAMTGIAVHTFQGSHIDMCHDPTLALLDVCLLDHIKFKFFLTEH